MEGGSSTVRQRRTHGSSRFAPKDATEEPTASTSSAATPASAARSLAGGWSIPGLILYVAYICSALFYFYVRLNSLNLLRRHIWYAILVLLAEAMGATAVTLYGLCIVRTLSKEDPLPSKSRLSKDMLFHIQILIPCYSEALDIVAETVWAAYQAELPPGCTATVWLLDDGCDSAKETWVAHVGHGQIRYVSGRKRPKGEVNGKAGNLNNLLRRLYGDGAQPPPSEHLIAIFDCDQVCERDFFVRTLPSMVASKEVAMVVTPQRFGNVAPAADIFNHTNRHFWEVMVPGLVSWGMVVCTGSNLVIRASALREVGLFPDETITEDFALGMELAMRGYRAVYIPEYLARGEAPEEGAIFRQRSRWCKGHMQAFMSRNCPLAQRRLSWTLRLLFFSGTWSYLTAAVCTPLFTAVPLLAVACSVFPIVLSPAFVLAFVPYFVLMHAVMYCCNSLDLLRALWFSSCATQILWYTYLKAFWNTGLYVLGFKRKGCFKTTVKTGVNAAIAEDGDCAPGTPGQLSRTVTPSTFGGSVLSVTDTTPCHRTTASAPSSLLHAALTATTKQSLVSDSTTFSLVASAVAAETAEPCADPAPSSLELQGLQRTLTMPALQRQMSEGFRPGWNLQIAASMDSPDSPAASPASSLTGVHRPVKFERLRVENISFGVLRDTWVPLLSLTVSAWTVVAGLLDVHREGPRKAATAVSVLWAAYNCIGPYLLVHYTWLGRSKSLERACSASMALAAAIVCSAALVVWLYTPAQYDLGQVLDLCYRFFEAQRSGRLPATNRIAFRGDSALLDRAPNGASLTGGFYDAGGGLAMAHHVAAYRAHEYMLATQRQESTAAFDADHLKTSFSMAVATSLLAWGMLAFPRGHALAGQVSIGRENLRWAAEYLVACHTGADEFVGQVGNMAIDHAYWGRPEDMDALNMSRPAYVINASSPGSDMAAQAAAALAASSMVLVADDASFAATALQHAKQLYTFATVHQGLFAASVPEMGAVYPSGSWRDDTAWAAAWLFLATREDYYLTEARAWLAESKVQENSRWQYYAANWDNMVWSTHVLLASSAGSAESALDAYSFLDKWRLGQVVRYTPHGLAYSDSWGTLRNAANAALLALIHAKEMEPADALPYKCWAMSQISFHDCVQLVWQLHSIATSPVGARYALGDGPRSFVVGFGRRSPRRPHHRAASCPPQPAVCDASALRSHSPNPHTLLGALVGGPDIFDAFGDDREQYEKSEVGIEYNAGFTAAVAGLIESELDWSRCQVA